VRDKAAPGFLCVFLVLLPAFVGGGLCEAAGAAGRRPVLSDRAAEHAAALGLTRRALAARLRCSLSTAQRVSKPGGFVPADLERRVLELEVVD
jgi:hypothetical protein